MMEETKITVSGLPVQYDADGLIPEHMRDGLRLYIENQIPPGSFLMAILSNDLMEAAGRADHININRLKDYCRWLYNYAPPGCYGSPEAVKQWLTKGKDQ